MVQGATRRGQKEVLRRRNLIRRRFSMKKNTDHVCEICGVSPLVKQVCFRSRYGMYMCRKHYENMRCHGKILDVSPYGVYDKNRYRIDHDVVFMDITDRRQNKIAEALYDAKYLEKVSNRKWRITYKNNRPYIVTIAYPEEKSKHMTLHRYVAKLGGLDIDNFEIDHINGNTFDNRLCNLRCATRLDQAHNVAPKITNKCGIRGVCYSKRDNTYKIDFINNHVRFYFKHFKTLPEAVYARYLMERYFFDDVVINRHLPAMQPYIDQLSDSQKRDLENYVSDIISRKEAIAS